jgi:hypothetical protein
MSHPARTVAIAALAIAGALGATAARAGDVHWSIGVNLPVYPNVAIGVSSGPPVYYRPAPVYYGAPVYVAPPVYAGPPVYVAPPRVVYVPRPVPVYSRPGYGHGKWQHRWRDGRWDGYRH